jgi:hypothetical protein
MVAGKRNQTMLSNMVVLVRNDPKFHSERTAHGSRRTAHGEDQVGAAGTTTSMRPPLMRTG